MVIRSELEGMGSVVCGRWRAEGAGVGAREGVIMRGVMESLRKG